MKIAKRAMIISGAVLLSSCSTMSIEKESEKVDRKFEDVAKHILTMSKKCWTEDDFYPWGTPMWVREGVANDSIATIELYAGLGRFPIMTIYIEKSGEETQISANEVGSDISLFRNFPAEVMGWAKGSSDCVE